MTPQDHWQGMRQLYSSLFSLEVTWDLLQNMFFAINTCLLYTEVSKHIFCCCASECPSLWTKICCWKRLCLTLHNLTENGIGRSCILACQCTFLCAKRIQWPTDYQWGNYVPIHGLHSKQWEGRQRADTALPEPDLKVSWAVTAPSHRDFTTQNLFWTFSQNSAPRLPGMEIMGCHHTKPLSQPHKHILALCHGKSLWSFVCYLACIKIYPNKQLCNKTAVLRTDL